MARNKNQYRNDPSQHRDGSDSTNTGAKSAGLRDVDTSPEEEAATLIRDDEEEVHDLGFIVENRRDERDHLLSTWQRLDDLDTDEALETDPSGPLPEEASHLDREELDEGWYQPADERTAETAAAEAEEEDFADDNRLNVDPDAEGLVTVPVMDEGARPDVDGDGRPERVPLRGHAPGITTGFGTSVPQDIGAEGFSIEENPLLVPADEGEYPISTEGISDEARGVRDVDDMGPEEALNRLADRGARLEEGQPPTAHRPASRRRGRDGK